MSQGGESNDSGRWLEQLVERTCMDAGYLAKMFADDQNNSDLFEPQVLIKNVPYQNLYGRRSWTEFVLADGRYDLRIRMECKTQEGSGSVHEKIPYFYLNAIRCMPENDVAFIYSGKWFAEKPAGIAAIEWLKNAAKTGLFAPDQRKRIHIVEVNNLRRFVREIAAGEL